MTKARDISKLSAVEADATADQTNTEVKAAVEAASDSNTFTDADHSKLNAIEASADVTDTANVAAAGALMKSGGTMTGSLLLNDVAQSIDFIQSGAINFDSNGDQTGRVLTIGSNRANGASGGTTNVTFAEDGNSTFTGSVTANAGVIVDNITIDGTTIALSSGHLNLDAAGQIFLDAADDGNVQLRDTGTQYGAMYSTSGNWYFKSTQGDKDIIFQGVDGVSQITALTLDMSDGGAARFGNDIFLLDGRAARFGNDQDFRIYNDGSHTTLQNSTLNHDILFKGNDDGSPITALTLDMSNAGKATFTGIVSSASGFETGNMFTTANEIDVSSGNLTLDVAGNISLDADDTGHVRFKDGGAQYASIYKSSSDAIIDTTGSLTIDAVGDIILDADGGDIVFKDGGTEFGSIGNSNGSMFIEGLPSTGKVGLTLYGSSIEPRDGGSAADNAVDLGATGTRFKDLHLSGEANANGFRLRQGNSLTGGVFKEFNITGTGSANDTSIFSETGLGINFMSGGSATKRMVITSSGNVGIGVSPSAKLDVVADDNVWVGEFTQSNTSNGDGVLVQVGSTAAADYALSVRTNAGNKSGLAVKADGNVGIGTFSPSAKLHINGVDDAGATDLLRLTYDNSPADTGMTFTDLNQTVKARLDLDASNTNDFELSVGADFRVYTGVTAASSANERLTILTGGNVGIGATDPQELLHVYHGSTSAVIRVSGQGNSNRKAEIGYNASAGPYVAAGSSGITTLKFYVDNTSLAMTIATNDVISGDFNDTSDIALKENITDLETATTKLKQLKPRTFDWKKTDKENGVAGFIAQEVETVIPKAVVGTNYENSGDAGKAINTTALLAYAIKTIQELEARITILEA